VHRLLVGLATQATLATIREQLDRIEIQIDNVRRELLQDRLAEVDSAAVQVDAALVMVDGETRRIALLNAIQTSQTAFAKLVTSMAGEIAGGVQAPTPLGQLLQPWRDPRDAFRAKVERIQCMTFGVVRAAALVVDAYAALGEPGSAAVALRTIHRQLTQLDRATVAEWARWTEPRLGAEQTWGQELPALVEQLDMTVSRLGDPVPVEIELRLEHP